MIAEEMEVCLREASLREVALALVVEVDLEEEVLVVVALEAEELVVNLDWKLFVSPT